MRRRDAFRTKEPDLGNFISDQNPFELRKPPFWWLQAIFDYDPDLVVVCSRMEAVYRLARKVRHAPGMDPRLLVDRSKDTAMLCHYNLVPALTMTPACDGSWNLGILEDLKSRDIWAHGGPDEFARKLEAQEKAAEKDVDDKIIDECYVRRRDMARSFKARTGQRTKMNRVKPKRNAVVMKSLSSQEITPSKSRIVLASS